jgi:hypothetical protein
MLCFQDDLHFSPENLVYITSTVSGKKEDWSGKLYINQGIIYEITCGGCGD